MKKTLLSLAVLSLTTLSIHASEVTYELGVKNDYRLNGISLSDKDPVIQGQIEYNHDNGWYLGTWATSTGDSVIADTELEVYGGKKHTFENDLTLDLGVIANTFHGHDYSSDLNYNQVVAKLSYDKFAFSLDYTNDFLGTDYYQYVTKFEFVDQLGDGFVNIAVSLVKNEENIYGGEDDYRTWEIGYLLPVTKDLELSFAYVDTDIDKDDFGSKDAQAGAVVGLNWTF